MTSCGRVCFFPLVIVFTILLVISSVIKASQVPIDNQCSPNERTPQIQLHEDDQGILRIKLCACRGVDDLSDVTVAETEDLCQLSGVLLEWDRNATIDRQCLLSLPLKFNSHGHTANLVLCPSKTQALWQKSIPLQLQPNPV